MNEEPFPVFEHLSYEMIATFIYARFKMNADDLERLCFSLQYSINPLLCKIRIFPDWQFSDFALDHHHEN